MQFSPEVFTESQTARNDRLITTSSQDAENTLNKVKQIFFAVWNGRGWMTSKQVAEFYDVSEETIDANFKRHKDEFYSDGVELVRSKQLEEVRCIMHLASSVSSINLFPPRAVMRMGFILRDSEVAKQVRTAALDIIEAIPSLVTTLKLECLNSLKEQPLGSNNKPITEITTDIRNGYGWAGNEDLLEEWLIALSGYANLNPQRQIPIRTHYKTSKNKTRRFDLMFKPETGFLPISTIIVVNEIKSNYISVEDIKDTYYTKEYIDLAYSRFKSYLIKFRRNLIFQFVSPCGITEEALKALGEVQEHANQKYSNKISIESVRLDDFVWNQIYPAIGATYRDKDGEIGRQFLYVRERIHQLCLEICNPDLWVDSFKNLRQESYTAIKARDRMFLPGHDELLLQSHTIQNRLA